MKHTTLVAAAAFSLVALPVFAQTTTPKMPIKQLIENHRIEVKNEVHEARIEFKQGELHLKQVLMGKVMLATANRFDHIISRIESRLSKLEAAGAVTTEARADVAAAKTNLAAARVHMSDIAAIDLTSATSSDAVIFLSVRTHATEAKQSFQAAKENLEKAVSVIRTIEKTVHVSDESTTTVSTH